MFHVALISLIQDSFIRISAHKARNVFSKKHSLHHFQNVERTRLENDSFDRIYSVIRKRSSKHSSRRAQQSREEI
jgi:hypothetical protein